MSDSGLFLPQNQTTFNRTIVELKLGIKVDIRVENGPFNRTIVELKYRYESTEEKMDPPLIAP